MNQLHQKFSKWIKKGNIFDKHRAQLPVVDPYPDRYRIYYSTRDTGGKSIPMFIEVDKNNISQLITPPTEVNIKLGNPGTFDWAGIMPTEIVSFKGIKYLYYIGWSLRKDVPYHNSLGLAISNDNGITWQKYSLGPVFSTNSIEYGYVGTAGIIIEDGLWKMWYLSCREWKPHNGKLEPIYDIKYATSVDGISWIPGNTTAIELQNNEGGISSARVFKYKNQYHMIFSVRGAINYRSDKTQSYRIKSAHSANGIIWERTSEPIIDISNADWENFMVCYPYIINNNDHYIMFYNGNNFGETGIGYAINE
jgi:hypothetical protein